MGYQNFKPTLWSKYIMHELEKETLFKDTCDYQFQGEVRKGELLKVVSVGQVALKKYTTGTPIDDPQIVDDDSLTVKIDNNVYFNYYVDDIDKFQSIGGLMEALQKEATTAIADDMDKFIAKEAALGAYDGNVIPSEAINNETRAKEVIDEMFVKLWANNVRANTKLDLFIPPWLFNLFQNKITELKTSNDALISNGVLGTYRGANVKMTNNLHNDGTDDHIILKTRKGYAFANGINEVQAYTPEKLFGDAVKGLNTYGGKAVRPKEIAVAKVHESE